MYHLFLSDRINISLKQVTPLELFRIIKSGMITCTKDDVERIKNDKVYGKHQDKFINDFAPSVSGEQVTFNIKKAAKNDLPTVIINTTHTEGNKGAGKEWTTPTKCLIIDLDIKDKNINLKDLNEEFNSHEELAQALYDDIAAEAERIEGLVLFWLSPSKKGIKLIYNIDVSSVSELAGEQKRIIRYLAESLNIDENLLNKLVDKTSNSGKQQTYLNQTDNIVYNPKALYVPKKKQKVVKTIKNLDTFITKVEQKHLKNYSPSDEVYKTEFDANIVKFIRELKANSLPEVAILSACQKWLTYPDNLNYASPIKYSVKIPKKIKEAFKGSFTSNTLISRQEDSDEVVLFNSWWFYIETKGIKTLHVDSAKLNEVLRLHGFCYITEDETKKLYVNRNNILTLVGKVTEDKSYYLYNHFFPCYLINPDGTDVKDRAQIELKTVDVFIKSLSKFNINHYKLSNLDREDKDKIKLYLENGAVYVTKDKVELVPYTELKKPIHEKSIKKESDNGYKLRYTKLDWRDWRSKRFISKISEDNQEKEKSLCSIIGYMLSKYKTKGNNKHVIFIDGGSVDKNKVGGTGKSTIARMISNLRTTCVLHTSTGGDKFELQNVTLDSEILYFEDINFAKNSESNFRYINDTQVKVEEKGEKSYFLTGYDAPRGLFTTNTAPDSEFDADIRRRIVYFMPDFYSKNYTVKMDLGHEIFNDYNQNDYDYWVNFMIHCCQVYLNHGIVEINEEERMRSKRFAQSLNNIDNEDIRDFFEDKCNEVVNTSIPYKFKIKELKTTEFPSMKMGAEKFNNFVSKICSDYGLDYTINKVGKHQGKATRYNVISFKDQDQDKLKVESEPETEVENDWETRRKQIAQLPRKQRMKALAAELRKVEKL